MSQQFRTVTTNAGRNAVREALAQGKTVKLSHMSVGDGGGSPVTPTSAMTALVNERFRAQINDIALDPATPDLFTAELFIPQAEGGFYIREVGLWTEDGTLFAVGNTPLTEKPDLSSGAATDLLVRLIIRVLDAAAVAIEIDPAQVLATRDYVDRKLDAHNKDGGAHESLARKNVQIKAGTGLSGGGTLEADRTLTVNYGNTPGTACQGNDARLSDTRTPKAHTSATTTYGAASETQYGHAKASATTPKAAGTASPGTETDAFARGDHVHPVQTTITGNAATATKLATPRTIALSGDATASGAFDGSGNLTLAATLKNSGTTAGSYGPGANATPAFGASFEVPEVTVDAKGRVTAAVARTVKIPANPSMTGATASAAGKAGLAPAPAAGAQGKYLRGDGTWQTPPNTTYGVATQGANGLLSATDKKALDYGEAFRLSMIGVPRFWRSTTLPAGHVWANGDLALFADWPELKKVYDGGGFNGMLLAYNANAATIAANLGKWRPNAANPTGLYVPKLGDQFFRGWTGGNREAGAYATDTGRGLDGRFRPSAHGTAYDPLPTGVFYKEVTDYSVAATGVQGTASLIGFSAAKVWEEHAGAEFAPTHIRVPVVFYLGLPA